MFRVRDLVNCCCCLERSAWVLPPPPLTHNKSCTYSPSGPAYSSVRRGGAAPLYLLWLCSTHYGYTYYSYALPAALLTKAMLYLLTMALLTMAMVSPARVALQLKQSSLVLGQRGRQPCEDL